mmetsp:Transcript_19151/g.38104  ORF Transcript_19151/g.38104 Transcript_19151/m.38104 type:complete len:89 (+) Transcript_19151:530-796(+)
MEVQHTSNRRFSFEVSLRLSLHLSLHLSLQLSLNANALIYSYPPPFCSIILTILPVSHLLCSMLLLLPLLSLPLPPFPLTLLTSDDKP